MQCYKNNLRVKVVNNVLEEKNSYYDGKNHPFLNTFKGSILVSHSYNRKKQCERKEEVTFISQEKPKYSGSSCSESFIFLLSCL